MPEPTGCAIAVMTWWEKISRVIFTSESAAKVCMAMDASCEAFRYLLAFFGSIFLQEQ